MARSQNNTYAGAAMSVNSRSTFITKTYMHLLGAVLGLIAVEYVLLSNEQAREFGESMMGKWMYVLGAYLIVSWAATYVVQQVESKALQYVALAAYVVIEAVILLPLLLVAQWKVGGGSNLIFDAAMITLSGFFALTAVVFLTRKDFSFLRGIIMFVGIIGLLLIVASFFMNFNLGVWFSVLMIVLAGAMILYDTSNIIRHYPEDKYVGASLSLFASLAMLFWYVLRLVISLTGDD
jgi:uncharacterized protein